MFKPQQEQYLPLLHRYGLLVCRSCVVEGVVSDLDLVVQGDRTLRLGLAQEILPDDDQCDPRTPHVLLGTCEDHPELPNRHIEGDHSVKENHKITRHMFKVRLFNRHMYRMCSFSIRYSVYCLWVKEKKLV